MAHPAHVLLLLVLLSVAAPCSAGLVFSEIHSAPVEDIDGDGVVDAKLDEWIELRNTGSTVCDLDGVFFRDGTGDTYHFGLSGGLAPGERRLITGADAVAWQAAQGLSTTGLSLNNSGDSLSLWRDLETPRILEVLDAVDVPSHAAQAGRSLGRHEETGEWLLFDAANPYGGTALPPGTGCAPSPGTPNECEGVVATEAASFGRWKATFD